MSADAIDEQDMAALVTILEREMASRRRAGTLWLAMFVVILAFLALSVVFFAVQMSGLHVPLTGSGLSQGAVEMMGSAQLVTALCVGSVTCFNGWWGVQNCVNSMERTIYAAHAQRLRLFGKFLEQIQCTDKKKQRLWLDIVEGALS